MSSSRNDNSIVFDAAALYLGSGGLDGTGESIGIRYAFANASGAPGIAYAAFPNGSIVQNLDGLWFLVAGVYRLLFPATAARFIGAATGIMAATPQAVAVQGAIAGDIVTATLRSDDTGGTLGGVLLAVASANVVTVSTVNAVTNGDGVVQIHVFRT